MPNNVPYWKLNPFFGEGEDISGKGYKPPPSDYYYRRPHVPDVPPTYTDPVEDELIRFKPPRPSMPRPQATPSHVRDMQAKAGWIQEMRGIEHTPNTMESFLGTLSPGESWAINYLGTENPYVQHLYQNWSDESEERTLSDYAQAGIPWLLEGGGPQASGGWHEWLNPTSGPSFLDDLISSLT